MYDVYQHVSRTELLLTTRHGTPLPERAHKSSWKLVTKKLRVSQLIADEIAKSGYSITRPVVRPS